MRHFIYKDINIPEKEYQKLLNDYKIFHQQTSGLDVSYEKVDWDFSEYPTTPDSEGSERMTREFISEMVARVVKKYGKYGTDHVKFLVHEDNWKSSGIWGTNWSYYFSTFSVGYIRWDKDNSANSFGTLNHEDDHAYDAIILTEIGIDINPVLAVKDYDAQTTHGGRYTSLPAYHGYIKFKENKDKLKIMAPYLQGAYKKRLERHTEEIKGMQMTIINLLEQLVYLFRRNANKKTTEVKK